MVEGDEDRRVIPQLIEGGGIPWGERPEEAIVWIEAYDGIDNLLAPNTIETELKASGLSSLGILIDANDDPESRWRRLRDRCLPHFEGFPEGIPPEGLVLTTASGLRFGVWLMPDNGASGMLESFLATLVTPKDELWNFARRVVKEAKDKAAPYRDRHVDKARIHTWLAWQDPPGNQLHIAILQRLIDASSGAAKPFLAWFRRLYGV